MLSQSPIPCGFAFVSLKLLKAVPFDKLLAVSYHCRQIRARTITLPNPVLGTQRASEVSELPLTAASA